MDTTIRPHGVAYIRDVQRAQIASHFSYRLSGKALLLQIGASGYLGSYSRVTDFIRS